MLKEKNKEIEVLDSKSTNNINNIKIENNNPPYIVQISREIYYFKNEMLKEFKEIEQRINSKIEINSLDLDKNKNEYENRIKVAAAKIDSILERIYSYNTFK